MTRCPDRPLVVKCSFNGRHKRITFQSARNCNYELLRHKVDQCFSLYSTSYVITWRDDDGEITNISTDDDLVEAILYFHTGDDAPVSSAASILSGRSFTSRKITIRVDVNMEYEGPSLSDTSSLASFDDFRGRNTSQHSFSIVTPQAEPEDDSVTVSSKDFGSNSRHKSPASRGRNPFDGDNDSSSPESVTSAVPPSKLRQDFENFQDSEDRLDHTSGTFTFSEGSLVSGAADRYPEDPSAVFEQLRLQDALSDSSSVHRDIGGNSRGQAWLRDQEERVIRSKLGTLPQPSEADDASSFSLNEGLGGDLALERNSRGSYYYTYTASSQGHDDGPYTIYDTGASENGVPNGLVQPRPSSMQLSWLASQQQSTKREPGPSTSVPSLGTHHSDPLPMRTNQLIDDPFAYETKDLPFLPLSEPPNDILTDCSGCGVLLATIRYVCSTCGEKEPKQKITASKGKRRETLDSQGNRYIPMDYLGFGSSPTIVGSSESLSQFQQQQQPRSPHSPPSRGFPSNHSGFSPPPTITGSPEPLPYAQQLHGPLHSLPSLSSFLGLRRPSGRSSPNQLAPVPQSPVIVGFELCPNCIDSAGVDHAILAVAPSPIVPSSPGDPQQALQWRKAPPKKGHFRHAYHEKLWGQRGWENVVQEESAVSKCSTCSAVTFAQRYKCAVCSNIHLCRACYSQVHDIHPSHPFIIVPDKPKRAISEPDFMASQHFDPGEEQSMKHMGVQCIHCMRDIFGARFHCTVCPDVDICSNCESAGLPGNLHSSEGGHDSSHIMLKIPLPLDATQVQVASRRARVLWEGGDAANVRHPPIGPQTDQDMSSYARTVVDARSSSATLLDSPDNHHISCSSCRLPIVGIRYQCAHCPSIPMAFNLCTNCEARSHVIHDPMHIFFKLPRPVHRPIESTYPLLPQLYRIPAGAQTHLIRQNDPKAYLGHLKHDSAICDRCMDRIQGEWFHCVYCPKDLCESCEALDTHNDTHFFVVFKSNIDMTVFKNFVNLDVSDSRQSPILPYPVYQRS